MASVTDYRPKDYWITVYPSRSFATAITQSVLSLDMSFRGGRDIKTVGMSPGVGTRTQFTYISSNKDGQFVLGTGMGNPSNYSARI